STEKFGTAAWLEFELRTQAAAAYNSDAPQEKQRFYNELLTAWQAFAYSEIGRKVTEEYRVEIRKEIQEYMRWSKSTSVTLHPKAVNLFDAMAEVSGISRKRGEATIDLKPFQTH